MPMMMEMTMKTLPRLEGWGGDADDDGDDHEDPSQTGYDHYVSISDRNLGDDLVVDAGDEVVEIGVDGAEWGEGYP